MLPCPLTSDERALFESARAWPGLAWPDLTAERLQELARTEGIDFATMLLYHRLRCSAVHGPFIERLEALPDSVGPLCAAADALVAVVPGGFYRERPDTGADGRFLLDPAVALGCRTAVVPLASFGSLRENARIVCNWLRAQRGSIVLVSLSKSGAEVRLALEEPDADACFADVRAWVNLSGVVRGTPMVSWLFRHPLRCLVVRLLFRLRGYSYQALHEMERGPRGLLNGPLRIPAHLKVVHLYGFPLRRHLRRPLSRRGHRRIAPLGPNDGGANLLADLLDLPGAIYPVWGADHYLRPDWNLDGLIRRMFHDLLR
jgi:hypothetical protein